MAASLPLLETKEPQDQIVQRRSYEDSSMSAFSWKARIIACLPTLQLNIEERSNNEAKLRALPRQAVTALWTLAKK